MGLLTDRINNSLERSSLINEHALNREPVPLSPSAKQRRNPCSVPLIVYQDLGTRHGCPAKEPWPICESGRKEIRNGLP